MSFLQVRDSIRWCKEMFLGIRVSRGGFGMLSFMVNLMRSIYEIINCIFEFICDGIFIEGQRIEGLVYCFRKRRLKCYMLDIQ